MQLSFDELHGMRRALLMLAILFFTIMLLEIDLGHRPALAGHDDWLVLVPVVWLPVALLALIVVGLAPTAWTVIAALAVMVVAALVGIVGSALHMLASGVDMQHLSRVFSSAVWGGPASPNWPVAITVAAVFGIVACWDADRDSAVQPRDLAGVASVIAYVLIVCGIGFGAVPRLVTLSATSLVVATFLLLAALIGMLANAITERAVS